MRGESGIKTTAVVFNPEITRLREIKVDAKQDAISFDEQSSDIETLKPG